MIEKNTPDRLKFIFVSIISPPLPPPQAFIYDIGNFVDINLEASLEMLERTLSMFFDLKNN